jgi:hypothetical protein
MSEFDYPFENFYNKVTGVDGEVTRGDKIDQSFDLNLENCHLSFEPQVEGKQQVITVEVWRAYYMVDLSDSETEFDIKAGFPYAQCYVSVLWP